MILYTVFIDLQNGTYYFYAQQKTNAINYLWLLWLLVAATRCFTPPYILPTTAGTAGFGRRRPPDRDKQQY